MLWSAWEAGALSVTAPLSPERKLPPGVAKETTIDDNYVRVLPAVRELPWRRNLPLA